MWKFSLPLFLVLEIVGFQLYGLPQGPDSVANWLPIVGAFLLFLAFSTSALSWGKALLLASRSKFQWLAPPLGCLFLCFAASFLGHMGRIGYENLNLAVLILSAGPLIVSIHQRKEKSSAPSRASALVLALLASFIFFSLLSFSLDSMADPLWYHLVGPRLFNDASKIFLPEQFPIALKSGLWEYLFLWGNLLLGAQDGGGLIAGQLFGQWTHIYLAAFGSFLVFRKILEKLLPDLSSNWLTTLAVLALLPKELLSTSILAKNDWGAILFLLTGLLLVLEEKSLLAGLFLGAAFTSKYTEAFAMLGILFLFPRAGWRIKKLSLLAAGFALGSFPILFRNGWLTGNPLFPTMNQFFHSKYLGPSWNGIEAFSGNGFSWGLGRLEQVSHALTESVFIVPAIIALALTPQFSKIRPLWKIAVAGFIPLLCFLSFTGPKAEIRLLGPALFFVIVFGALSVKILWEELIGTKKSILICLFLLIPSYHLVIRPLKYFANVRSVEAPSIEIRKHPGGEASAWMRLNLKAGTKIASGSEPRLYYLLPVGISRVWDDPVLDQKLGVAKNVKEIFNTIKESGIQYLLITTPLWDTYFDQARWDLMTKASVKFPEALVFSNENSRIIDVNKMCELVKSL